MKKSILILFLAVGLLNAKFVRDNDKEVVFDTKTNLMWQDNIDSKTIEKSWRKAIDYCETLTLGEYNDWYLPNFNELYYLANRSKYSPSIDGEFINIVDSFYWTSTTYVERRSKAWNKAWVVQFNGGGDYDKEKSKKCFVRCVRDGE